MTELYDRAKLLGDVWSEPVQVVAPRYGLSDVGLKKLCARLQIATPPRGYWAKLKAGKPVPPRPKLREYKGPALHLLDQTLRLRLYEPSLRSDYVPSAAQLAEKAKGGWSYWPKWQYTPSGRLQVLADDGYGGKVTDSERHPVELQLNKLIGLMATRAVEFLVRNERQAIEDAERQRVRDIALERKRRQDAEKQRLAKLEVDAQNWGRAQAIREYLNALEQTTEGHELSAEDVELLRWGRAKADWLDPLTLGVVDALDEEIPSLEARFQHEVLRK